jgi:hypothetical protein
MFKKILVAIVVFGSIAFFEPSVLTRPYISGIHMIIIGIIVVFTLLHLIYDHSPKIRPGFSFEILLIFVAVVLSVFGAFAYHNQDFIITLYAQRTVYFFLLYYFLHQVKPDPVFLKRLIIAVAIAYAIIYIVQYAAYPLQLFGSKMFKDRNTIRIFVPGTAFAVTAYYIAFMRFLKTSHYKYILLMLLLLVVFTMLGTRQLIAPVFLISLIIVVKSKRVESKVALSLIALISVIPLYFIFQEIFDAMMEVTRQQSISVNENVRVKAASFYLYHFAPNKWSFLTGNGAYSSHSPYGISMENYSKLFGYYLADIGIIGEYILYGALFIVAELIILFRLAIRPYSEDFQFIRYVSYSVFFSLFVSAGIFGSSEGIVVVCILLYLTDVVDFREGQLHPRPA